MADEKKMKLEIVETPDFVKGMQNTISEVVPKVQKMGSDAGKKIAEAIIKSYENLGYKFREVEIEPEKKEVQTALLVNDNSPMYVSDLLEVGLIDRYFRCDSLEKVAVFIMRNRHKTGVSPYVVLRSRFLRQFKRLDGSDFSNYAISKARKAAKEILEEEE